MKILLTILVLIFNPIITDKGIQIGEIRTNNQIIKIIKMNLNNPAFLQMAGNAQAQAKEYISFVDTGGNPQIKLSCDGGLRIVSTYNGKKITQTLSNISQQAVSIQSDPNTEIFIYGKVTVFDTTVSRPGGTTKISELNTLYAKSLTYLNCNSNQLTSLDVSEKTALTYLSCSYNQLTSLDVSANTALTDLNCTSNQLTSLDVSENTALTNLYCDINQLTSLDVSANTALTDLSCGSNQLTSLDVSANTALTDLYCGSNSTLLTIDGIGVDESVATNIASAITYATSVDGTVTLRQGDEFNQTIIDAAMDKGWDVQYYQ